VISHYDRIGLLEANLPNRFVICLCISLDILLILDLPFWFVHLFVDGMRLRDSLLFREFEDAFLPHPITIDVVFFKVGILLFYSPLDLFVVILSVNFLDF
jgi:hypothetical protein